MEKEKLNLMLLDYPEIYAFFNGNMDLYLSYGEDDFTPVSRIKPVDIELENGQKLTTRDIEKIIDYGMLKDCYVSCTSSQGIITIPLRKLDILMHMGYLNNNERCNNDPLEAPDNGLTKQISKMLYSDKDYQEEQLSVPIAKIAKDYDCSENYSVVPYAKYELYSAKRKNKNIHSQK
jgi:hypothetical protein